MAHHRASPARPGRRLFSGTAERDRGAALIEAALATPIFFLMIMGLMDGAWALYGDHVIRGSSAAGVRSASALANDSDADFQALTSVKKNIETIGRDKLVRVVVYRANGYGDKPTATCQAGTAVPGLCNVYDGADLDRPTTEFGCIPNVSPDRFWCPTARKTATTGPNSPPDYIGVWVEARHRPLTGVVIRNERVYSTHSVLRVEPRSSE